MTEVLRHSGRHGTYQIQRQANIVIATLSGAMSLSMAERYYQDLQQLASEFQGREWAYVGDARQYQASTPDAVEYLEKAYRISLENGCISDAYCLDSAMAIAQLQTIREKCGISAPIQDRLFSCVEQAIAFSEKKLLMEV